MRILFDPDEGDAGGGAGEGTGGQAASGTLEPGAGDAGQQPTETWEQYAGQEVPAAVSERFGGAKTWADIEGRYSNSSREAQRLNDSYAQAQQLIDRQQNALAEQLWNAQRGGQQTQQTQQRDSRLPPGVSSVEEYNALLKTNPNELHRRIAEGSIAEALKDPKRRQELLGGALEPVQAELQQFRQQQQLATVRSTAEGFYQANPDFGPGKPLNPLLMRVFESSPHLQQLAMSDPREALELASGKVLRAVQGQQLKAAQAKAAETRSGAATSRPGAGGGGQSKGGTFEQRIREIAAKEGGTEEQIQQTLRYGRQAGLIKKQ